VKLYPGSRIRWVRLRILLQGLVAVLMITGALIVGESGRAGYRTGAVLLLGSGVLFLAVVVVDSFRSVAPAKRSKPDRASLAVPDSPAQQVRRIRPPGFDPRTRSSKGL
jgi:hypothetical protein